MASGLIISGQFGDICVREKSDDKIELGELPKAFKINLFTADIILAESELKRLQGTQKGFVHDIQTLLAATVFQKLPIKLVGTPEEIEAQKKVIEKLRLELEKFKRELLPKPDKGGGKGKIGDMIELPEMVITPPPGLIGKREQELQGLQRALPFLKTEKDITENLKEQKRLRQELDSLQGIANTRSLTALQLANGMQSNLNSINAGLMAIGVSTDSWLGKLIGGLQTLVAIYEAIAAIQSLVGILGFLSGGGAAPALMPIVGGGIAGSRGGSTGSTNITINQSFSAFDGRGLKQTFNKPEVRNAITSAIADAARKGKV